MDRTTQQLHALGQSLWIDNISRETLRDGSLARLIKDDDVTTIFPRQGHYALDTIEAAKYPTPDITVDHIGDLARTNIAGWFPLPGANHEQDHAATP